MAYFSLHAYDADVWIRSFKGLNQANELNGDVDCAWEEFNVETPHGVLQPAAANLVMEGQFEHRVETLCRFYRRWFQAAGSKSWLVCCAGGHFYYQQEGTNLGWIEIPLPAGLPAFTCSVWSWVTYEDNEVQGVDHPVDFLILSNAEDGMIYIYPPDRPSIIDDYEEDTIDFLSSKTLEEMVSPAWAIQRNTSISYKFGVIERYAERIWGGAIPDDPDMLVYSRPYEATNWTEAGEGEQPEEGAGSIQQPSWDGDSFTTLRAFGDQLLAFKEHRVWRVYGTNPGEFTFNQQFGGGAPYPNTVAVDVEQVFMVDKDGPSVYDGMSVKPFMREQIAGIWRTVNPAALDQMCAVLWRNRYYLSIPVDGSPVNNAMVVFDQDEGTILFYKDVYIESLMATPDGLYATSSSLPGKVMMVRYDSWIEEKASGRATKWVSPWMDFGYKRIQKGGFDFYFAPEVQDEAVELTISIQTEKKTKTKNYTVQPLTEEQKAAGKEARYKKLHFGGTGRKFRIVIESAEGVTAPWRIVGGLHLVVETDPD